MHPYSNDTWSGDGAARFGRVLATMTSDQPFSMQVGRSRRMKRESDSAIPGKEQMLPHIMWNTSWTQTAG